MWEKIKLLRSYIDRKDVFTIVLIVLTNLVSFVLGNLSALEAQKVPVTVEVAQSQEAGLNQASIVTATQSTTQKSDKSVVVSSKETPKGSSVVAPSVSGQKYVASKSGTKYHLPTCTGAKKIAEKNKIWFATKEEAEQAGFSPASNCKGI